MHKLNKVSSLYIHFPFCRHLCNYCDFYKSKIGPESSDIEEFGQDIRKNFKENAAYLKKNNIEMTELETVFIGGGTPSLWGSSGRGFLREILERNTPSEVTIEVNPGTVDIYEIRRWIDIGVNRFSIGVQSLSDRYLETLDRLHRRSHVISLLEEMKKEGINYSVDFMIGLPKLGSEKRDIISELEEVLSFNPAHISVYILTTKSNYKWINYIPLEEEIASEYLLMANLLKSKGYEHYEVSNFAKPGMKSQHNLMYWRGRNVSALGPSATGYIKIDNSKAVRYKWKSDLREKEIEYLDSKQIALEELYLGLRLSDGLRVSEIESNLITSSNTLQVIENWKERGLLINGNSNRVQLNTQGFLVLDSLVQELF